MNLIELTQATVEFVGLYSGHVQYVTVYVCLVSLKNKKQKKNLYITGGGKTSLTRNLVIDNGHI